MFILVLTLSVPFPTHVICRYNGISNMGALQLSCLPSLRALFLQGWWSRDSHVRSCDPAPHTGNEISRVDGLVGLTQLTELVLDRNRVKVCGNL